MTVEERIEKENEIKRHKRNARITLFAGIALVLIVPYLLTNLPFIKCTDTATTGQIGDTVGGLTSPIVNLISAILIYLSFQQQLVANEIQISMLDHEKSKDILQIEKDEILFHYNEIKDSITSIKYTSHLDISAHFSSVDAIERFVKDLKSLSTLGDAPTYYLIRLILIDVETLIESISTSDLLSDGEKEYYNFRIHNLFFQRLAIPLDGIEDVESKLEKKEISGHLATIRTKLGVPPNS